MITEADILTYDRPRYSHNHTAGVETFIPHVALYAWVHLYKPKGDGTDMPLAGMRCLFDRAPLPERTVWRFTEEVVVDSIGCESVFARFECALRDAFEPGNIEFLGSGDVAEPLNLLLLFLKHPEMRMLAQKRETFRYIVEYLDQLLQWHFRETPSNAKVAKAVWIEWEMSLQYFE